MLSDYRDIIKAPIITEKSTSISSNEKSYVFKVDVKANKSQIKDAVEKIFNVKVDYQPDAGQLEIFKNGLRLAKGVHYQEVLKEGSEDFCDRFELTLPLVVNDVIVYRIMRTVSSYADLKLIIKEYEEQIRELREDVTEQVEAIADVQDTINANHHELQETVSGHTLAITALQNTALTTLHPVTISQLEELIQQNIVLGKINLVRVTDTAQIFLPDVREQDFITVAYTANDNADLILLSKERNDYDIQNEDDGALLILDGRWLDSATAQVYITGLKIGVR